MGHSHDHGGWREELPAHREEKDRFFAEHRQSPLPGDDRSDFDGLGYYDPDPDYRLEATVEPPDPGETFEMEMTAGEPVEYERVARLEFDLDGPRELYAYRQPEGGGSLFVPFRDATAPEGTYGAGQYMEFEVDGDLEDARTVTLDFNLAYFPFRAYNDAFACPLPPAENHLDVRIEAGERF
ncbi:hypothetical protein BRC93_04035 [Halobacteriales archaeon QS_5_70_15]|nr:MAG: hypothetical protein BRC93_04035 [Halobacteriales archaeon QS_5_70_15]